MDVENVHQRVISDLNTFLRQTDDEARVRTQ